MPNRVATCASTPEISSHAKALPAPFEWERNPDRPHPVWCRAIAFLLFARMIIETALPKISNRKFDANARRSTIFTSEFGDIEFGELRPRSAASAMASMRKSSERAQICAWDTPLRSAAENHRLMAT